MSIPPAFAGLRADASAAGCTFTSASDATAALSPFARATLFAKFSFAAFARARRCARISATRDFTDSSAANSLRGESRRMRSLTGGCVSSIESTDAKSMCETSPCQTRNERPQPAASARYVSRSAFASPSGLRVNCADAASARNSRSRETAHCTSRAKKVPIMPTNHSAMPVRT